MQESRRCTLRASHFLLLILMIDSLLDDFRRDLILALRMLRSYLFGVSAQDPLVFGFAALLLIGVAAAASVIPAIRAAKMDPVAAVRQE